MKASRFAVALVLGGCVWGQTSQVSQVSGAVQDATGAAIPDAEITITTVNTAVARTVRSGRDGSYLLSNLPPGPYTLRGSKNSIDGSAYSVLFFCRSLLPQPDRASRQVAKAF